MKLVKSMGIGGLLCLFLLSVYSCKKEQETNIIDTEFFIPVEKSNLYVRLVGNENKPLIIDLHGGPGAFSGFNHEQNRKYLEDDFLIAYLDQRGGGKSEISTDTTMLNMKQFVDDLDVVVDTLKNRFQDKNINLLGSSWGGTYGLLYLMEHQEKITSFACISGKADGLYPIYAIIAHNRELAKKLIQTSTDVEEKERFEEILIKLDEIENSGFNHFFEDMTLVKFTFPAELGFDPYWYNKEAKQKAKEMGADSAVYKSAHYTKAEFDMALEKMETVNRVFRNTHAYNHLNIIDEIAIINKPVLVLQGAEDYAIGIDQANRIYKALTGIPENKKELHIIPDAAHNVNMEAPDEYYSLVQAFFKKYN